MINYKALITLMSGSGPSVYGIFSDFQEADECFRNFKKIYKNSFSCKPTDWGIKILP
jgi:4-diphosphocytidyl-2C-methyl-D-erythritol kinase